jgi:hypothetical protein
MGLLTAERNSSPARAGLVAETAQRASALENSGSDTSQGSNSTLTKCRIYCNLKEVVVVAADLAAAWKPTKNDAVSGNEQAGANAGKRLDESLRKLVTDEDLPSCIQPCVQKSEAAQKELKALGIPVASPDDKAGTNSHGTDGTSGGSQGDGDKHQTSGGNSSGTSGPTTNPPPPKGQPSGAGESQMMPPDAGPAEGHGTTPGRPQRPSCIASAHKEACYCEVSRNGEMGSCGPDIPKAADWAFLNTAPGQAISVFAPARSPGDPLQPWIPPRRPLVGISAGGHPALPDAPAGPAVDPLPRSPLGISTGGHPALPDTPGGPAVDPHPPALLDQGPVPGLPPMPRQPPLQ